MPLPGVAIWIPKVADTKEHEILIYREFFTRPLRNAINSLFLLNISGHSANHKVVPIIAFPGETFGFKEQTHAFQLAHQPHRVHRPPPVFPFCVVLAREHSVRAVALLPSID
jgi:hypothetical protein